MLDRMKTPMLALLLLGPAMGAQAGPDADVAAPEWYQRLSSPGAEARPWNFWYWMYGCVTDEGIRADLVAMRDAGLAGFYLMPIKDVEDGPEHGGTASQLSGEWWRRMDTAFSVADSLGLEMGIHFSDGFALGGGPWITPRESMQKVVWSDTIIGGGKREVELAVPESREGYYEDIAVLAYPARYADARVPECSATLPLSTQEPCDITMSYDGPFCLRSVRIVTGGNNYQAHRFKVYASDDGVDYRPVRELEPARQGWQNTDAYATYAIEPTTARHFRFHWTPEGSDPGAEDMDAAKWKPSLKVAGIILGSEPVVDGYEGKSGLVWRVSGYHGVRDDECVGLDEVIDLTGQYLDAVSGGKPLAIDLPEGSWHVLRMGHTSTGHTNATGGGGKGLECDKFSREAIGKQFNGWFGAIRDHVPSDVAKRVLTRLHVDSWECGSQNWSGCFAREFEQRRGYDLMPWLPLYAGVPMESSERSERVLRDIRQTIAELIDEVFFDEVERLARECGCKLSTECVAPTMVSDGMLHFRHADFPMGEFWLNSPTHDKPNDMLDAVSGAHVYGKNVIQAEGFTEVRGTWDEHPGMLKALLDRNYCLGINCMVFHVNTHNPWLDRAPGMTLDGIGTFFQRDNTWYREMPAFTGYVARCQALLQYGSPVVDLAVYTGDETPRRSILPERLVTTLPGLFGPEAIERETKRLANEGQPLEVSPVGVTHTLNMTRADAWTNPLHGYRYDSFNRDALEGSRIEDGRLVTRDGMEYAALVIPQGRKMNPDRIVGCWDRIDALEAEGLRVLSDPWTEGDLSSLGIAPDMTLPEGIDFAHRSGPDADVYFISNQRDEAVTLSPATRAQRRYGYVYDPMLGEVYPKGGELALVPHGSAFIILSDTELDPALLSSPVGATTRTDPGIRGWSLYFEKTGKALETDTLPDWSRSQDDAVRYYSGHVTYQTTFRLARKAGGRVLLDLGDVENIATVRVNGQDCGTSWMAPHRVDITKAVRKGKNDLEVVVVNTWANALRGNDAGTPPFDGIWTNGRYRLEGDGLLRAGLLGPVALEIEE